MMFFDFSLQKIGRLVAIILLIIGATFVFIYKHPNLNVWTIGDLSQNYINRGKAMTAYWWSYKLFGEEGSRATAINGSSQFMSPARSAWSAFWAKIYQREEGEALQTTATAKSIPVLLYHGESEETAYIVLPNFVDQMRTLKDNGWRTITMSQFYEFIKKGEPVPDKSFLLTFDDGRKDSYYPTDPVLQDLGFTAVMFVITGFSLPDKIERERSTYYLSKTELETMQASGRWELQSHGKEDHVWYTIDGEGTEGHFMSNRLWIPEEGRGETTEEFIRRVESDLRTAKTSLERELGKPIVSFAFPFSDYGQDYVNFEESREIVRDIVSSLYDLAFYQVTRSDGDTFNYPDPSAFMMKRIEPLPTWSGAELLLRLEAGRAKDLPHALSYIKDDWIRTWGEMNIGPEGMSLAASPDTTGAAAFLNGSELWADYDYTATIDWERGSDVMLVTRHNNANNYLFCAFSQSRIALRHNNNGIVTTIFNEPYAMANKGVRVELGMSVNGSVAGCSADGREVRRAFVPGALPHGGVGVQTWDKTAGASKILVREIAVTENTQ